MPRKPKQDLLKHDLTNEIKALSDSRGAELTEELVALPLWQEFFWDALKFGKISAELRFLLSAVPGKN